MKDDDQFEWEDVSDNEMTRIFLLALRLLPPEQGLAFALQPDAMRSKTLADALRAAVRVEVQTQALLEEVPVRFWSADNKTELGRFGASGGRWRRGRPRVSLAKKPV